MSDVIRAYGMTDAEYPAPPDRSHAAGAGADGTTGGTGMSRDEERVRAAWELVTAGRDLYGYGITLPSKPAHTFVGYETEAAAWSAAAAYTDAVIEEAARMRDEIALIDLDICACQEHGWTKDEPTYKRILARLQALYDAHVRGLKSEALR